MLVSPGLVLFQKNEPGYSDKFIWNEFELQVECHCLVEHKYMDVLHRLQYC